MTDDGSEVIVFGQHTGTMTLTDHTGSSTTLRSRGSYEVYVAAYDATDGSADAAQKLADNMVGRLLHERCVGIGATLARSELCLRSCTSAHERVHCM